MRVSFGALKSVSGKYMSQVLVLRDAVNSQSKDVKGVESNEQITELLVRKELQ